MASGKNTRLYRNDGTRLAPILVEIPEARDIEVPWTAEEVNDNDRSSGFMQYCDGLIDVGISTTFSLRNLNANNQNARNAVLTGRVNEYFVLDGPADVAGSEGIRFFGRVYDASQSHPLSDSRTMAVSIKPAYHEVNGVAEPPLAYVVP